jgi:hypothetical protein
MGYDRYASTFAVALCNALERSGISSMRSFDRLRTARHSRGCHLRLSLAFGSAATTGSLCHQHKGAVELECMPSKRRVPVRRAQLMPLSAPPSSEADRVTLLDSQPWLLQLLITSDLVSSSTNQAGDRLMTICYKINCIGCIAPGAHGLVDSSGSSSTDRLKCIVTATRCIAAERTWPGGQRSRPGQRHVAPLAPHPLCGAALHRSPQKVLVQHLQSAPQELSGTCAPRLLHRHCCSAGSGQSHLAHRPVYLYGGGRQA